MAALSGTTGHGIPCFEHCEQMNGKVERAEVELGLRDSQTEMVEARSGVTPGDTILLGTARGLTPGTAVRVSTPNDSKR